MPFKFKRSRPYIFRVRYLPGTLSIYANRESVPLLTVPLDLQRTLNLDNGTAWVGFTTSNLAQTTEMSSWSFGPYDKHVHTQNAGRIPSKVAGTGEVGEAENSGPGHDDKRDSQVSTLAGAEDLALLNRVMEFYASFATLNVDDTDLALETAKVHCRVGDIQNALGNQRQAVEAYSKCVTRLEALRNANGDKHRYTWFLRACYGSLSNLYYELGEFANALDYSLKVEEVFFVLCQTPDNERVFCLL